MSTMNSISVFDKVDMRDCGNQRRGERRVRETDDEDLQQTMLLIGRWRCEIGRERNYTNGEAGIPRTLVVLGVH